MKTFLLCIVCILIGNYIGWIRAHLMISAECDRNGGFFVGTNVYKCVRKEGSEDET